MAQRTHKNIWRVFLTQLQSFRLLRAMAMMWVRFAQQPSVTTHSHSSSAHADFAIDMWPTTVGSTQWTAVQRQATATPTAENINDCYALLANLHILLAEDNMVNAYLLLEQFELYQAKVTHVLDGRGALDVALQDKRPDVIIMDCQMPEMDGFESTMAIRDAELHRGWARIPIIAVTALTSASEKSRCLNAGMDAHVPKPFEMNALVCMIYDLRHAPSRHEDA